ncbi:hypothetical protein B0H10DRAFT_2220310 [Mycena sp. CBHHK59/15]|nr:hypothetical protein B0H10DRAFT_2220310 [Mycena sp. CBHHK59/15]
MSRALGKVMGEVRAKSITAVTIVYVMQKVLYCFLIISGHKIEQLMSNIEALDISLSKEQITYLKSVLLTAGKCHDRIAQIPLFHCQRGKV